MDVFELIAQFLDVAEVDSQQVDLIGDAGGVEGLRVSAATAGRAEAGGVITVFKGVGAAGRCAAFFLGRGLAADMGRLLGNGMSLWYRYIIEYMF
jgi:hypothetical protein